MRILSKRERVIESCIEYALIPPKGKIIAKHVLRSLKNSDLNWDPWLLKDDDVYRLFYLAGSNRSFFRPWWRVESKIYGAISTDMKHWQDMGLILDTEANNAWEAGRICAGCTLKEDGTYYLFYSAVGKEEKFMDEGIGLAISTDGLNWQRTSNHPFVKPDKNHPWYGDYNGHFQWRDPYVIKDPKTGKYYMFIAAHLKQNGVTQHFGGCIGLAVADKIGGPYELLPPAAVATFDDTKESPFYEMERPQVIYHNGTYHLFFSAFVSSLNLKWLQKVGINKISDSSLYWYVSDEIYGPFKPTSDKPVVKGSEQTGIYGTNFFPSPDNPENFIVYGWRHRLFGLDISSVFQARWQDKLIEIKKTKIRSKSF